MSREYTRKEMLQWLEAHFTKMGYKVTRYSDDFLPVRVPLYCKKELNGKSDELAVELTTNSSISKDDWFHLLDIGGVETFSSVSFYRYYFVRAKTYLAYPDYVVEDDEFKEFKKECVKKDIGLLRVSGKAKKGKQDQVEEVCNAHSLFEEISGDLNIEDADIKKRLEYYLSNFLYYFVYYPEPVFKKRAITGRMEGNVSFVLVDRLCELENISYKNTLIDLGAEYRQESRDDYKIALETIKDLWSNTSNVEYPEIQRQLEDILLRNSEYRDHFLHQFQVFLLGAYIIDGLYDSNERCIAAFKRKYKCPLEEAWLFASTYHDFNYSIQRYGIWSKEFFSQALNTTSEISSLRLDAAFIRENFFLKTREICEALGLEMSHVVMNFFYEQATEKRNHGLLSALSLLKLFKSSGKRKMRHSALVQSAIAIALHDENIWKAFSGRAQDDVAEEWRVNFVKKKFLKNVDFEKFPLLFLLIFCDTVQEWGRVGKNYKESEPQLEALKVDTNEITVNLSVKDDPSYNKKVNELQRVKRFLKDTRFRIDLDSREGGQSSTVIMQGR